MRVIVAGRLSRKVTDRDPTGFDSQEREAVEWAERQGHRVVAVVADFKTGRAGLAARPHLKPWVTEPEYLVQYDGIVALKLDRLTRGNRQETAELEQWARDHGKVLMTTEGLQFPVEGGEGIPWDLYMRLAHDEWLRISERYTRMQRELRAQGSHVGRSPYGYDIVREGSRKVLKPNTVEAGVIRDAVDWYMGGDSLDVICERLNKAGRLPRPMKDGRQATWQAMTLGRVLRKEVLVGRNKDSKGRTVSKVEPILDRSLWEEFITRLDQRAYRKGVAQSANPAMLAGVIKCGKCGRNMYRHNSGTTVRGGPHLAYYCRPCKAYVRLREADATVSDLLSADTGHDVETSIVPGREHEHEIAEVERDMLEAVKARQYDRLAALQIEMDRLEALPADLPRIERQPARQTVAEMWSALPDDAARRRYLLSRDIRAIYLDGVVMVELGLLKRTPS